MSEAVDREAFKRWNPAAQEAALEALRERTRRPWRPFFCPDRDCEGHPHGEWAWPHARHDQRPPLGVDWLTWLLTGGRGAGKTRTGSEYVHQLARHYPRIGLIGATSTDIRGIMLEGESGLLTIAPPDRRPTYEPSKRKLTWPNGAVALLFSAEEPDRLRGPEHYAAWWDEPAHAPLVQECWDNLLLGLRLGPHPHIVATTTPKPRKWLKEVIASSDTRIAKPSTYDNLDNLAPQFAARIISRYEGTRMGRQELHGELLEDVEGALWNWDMIEQSRVAVAPPAVRTVVGVDPAGSSRRGSDETGIITVSLGEDGHYYVVGDASGRYSPYGWATAATAAHDLHGADAVIAEVNFGAEMVGHTLRTSGFHHRLLTVRARHAKDVRAEPVVGLYEQGLVHHVGTFPELEEQMTSWVPYSGDDSPDRVDALVYPLLLLSARRAPSSMSLPTSLPRPSPFSAASGIFAARGAGSLQGQDHRRPIAPRN